MKLLKLSDGINYAVVDDEDYERLLKSTWYFYKNSIRKAIYSSEMYSKYRTPNVMISIQNEIMNRYDVIFDHIDRDFKNNQKANLREATQQQNCMNRTKSKSYSSSKYKGVYYAKGRRLWIAQIKQNRKAHNLGGFKTQEEAALKYNEEALKRFGSFAAINVIEIKTETVNNNQTN